MERENVPSTYLQPIAVVPEYQLFYLADGHDTLKPNEVRRISHIRTTVEPAHADGAERVPRKADNT